MSKYVPDVSTRRWVIIADGRENRPDETDEEDRVDQQSSTNEQCPFCPGNEHMTPKEVYRKGGGDKDKEGWVVRVIPNKYPITDRHEIIIHGPKEDDLHHMPKHHIMKVFQTYRHRYNEYCDDGQVIIFCNRGEHAGASIRHPHSQLVVLPQQINLSALEQEPMDNVVEENKFFDIYCPDFSQWPYEIWIVPKEEDTVFGDITDEEIEDLVELYVKILNRLEELHPKKSKTGRGFSYNFYIYPKENWYIRIIPRFVYRAGFELGTGLSVNVIDPKDAAEELRGTSDQGINGSNDQNNEKVIEEKNREIDRLKGKLEELGIGS